MLSIYNELFAYRIIIYRAGNVYRSLMAIHFQLDRITSFGRLMSIYVCI